MGGFIHKQYLTKIALFCTIGWVCVGGAIEANGVDDSDIFQEGQNTAAAPLPVGQGVKVGSFGEVDLHVKDLEVAKVLQLLSIQSQRNIIASRNVAGVISADLYGVDFYEALDAVLHTNGFGYQEKGNLIYVYTAAELEQIKETEIQLVHRIVRLNYITANDASTFVTPLLSEAGSISISGEVSSGFQPSIGDGGANSFAHTDTMIIHDYAEVVDEILAVLAELDVRPSQVLVEATVLRSELDEKNAFGVDLSVLANFGINQFANPLNVVDSLINGVPNATEASSGFQTTVGDTGSANSSTKIGFINNSVAAFITALDSVNDTTVVANPKLLVLNRQRADLLVGNKDGYISTTQTETSTTTTVEFLETGIQLTLRPFVSDDGFVRMELKPSISSGGVVEFAGEVIPSTENQELTTNVVVRNGQTVVLGGLFKEETKVDRSQVPGLGDIPIIGVAFKGQNDEVLREEVIFLITPTILKDEQLYATGDRASESIELARLGAREGLLPWSKTKLITSYLREAQGFFDQGDREKALWAVNMILTIDPKLMDAIRLKETLTSVQTYLPANLSILKETLDTLIHDKINGAALTPEIEDSSSWSSEQSWDSRDGYIPHTPDTDSPSAYEALDIEPGFDPAFDEANQFNESGSVTDGPVLQIDGEAPISEPAGSPGADPFNSVVDWLVPATEEQDAQ